MTTDNTFKGTPGRLTIQQMRTRLAEAERLLREGTEIPVNYTFARDVWVHQVRAFLEAQP